MEKGAVSWQDPDVLVVVGEVDLDSVVDVRKAGEKLIDGAGSSFLVDLGGLTSAHSVALSLLVRWMAYARQQEKTFEIRGMPAKLFDVARVSGMETILPLVSEP